MTDWWPSCKKFARAAKEDADIQKILSNVVLLQVDCEKGEGVELAPKYKIRGYPTFYLVNQNEEPLYVFMGTLKSIGLIKWKPL